MSPSRDKDWQRVQSLEEILAQIAGALDRVKVIRAQAWHEGSWEAVFIEATHLDEELSRLRETIAARWAQAMTGIHDAKM